MGDLDFPWDEQLAAMYWAIRHMPPGPEQVRASKAQGDLWGRIKSGSFRDMTRDEKKLDRHYQAVHDAYVADVLTAYRNR